MVGLKDVALELGVSVSLVSKVLNDRLGTTGVRPALVEKIQTKAKAMGYQRNLNAVALLTNKQNAFAVFLHRHGSKGTNFAQELLEGISSATRANHIRMILNFFTETAEFDEKMQDLHTGIVDGIILTGVVHKELVGKLLAMLEQGLKLVTIYNTQVHPMIPNVGFDDEELTYISTKHLIDQGCRRIAHFNSVIPRTKGYRRALKEAGLSYDSKLVVPPQVTQGQFTPEVGFRSVAYLLKRGIQFDGIAAQSDTQALGAMQELRRRGVRVPDDVKIIGVDDSTYCELSTVPLSSVNQCFYERGREATKLLELAIQGKQPGSIKWSPKLMARESSGA